LVCKVLLGSSEYILIHLGPSDDLVQESKQCFFLSGPIRSFEIPSKQGTDLLVGHGCAFGDWTVLFPLVLATGSLGVEQTDELAQVR
jgi:hypothetical protein